MARNVMIDIETLGTDPGCCVLSVAAVEFNDKYETGRYTTVNLNLKEQVDNGFTIDFSTVKWWAEDELRWNILRTLVAVDKDKTMYDNLNDITKFIGNPDTIWSKSPRFDLSILEALLKKFNVKKHWNFRSERDVRTIAPADIYVPKEDSPKDIDLRHNPMHDCYWQIKQLKRANNKKL